MTQDNSLIDSGMSVRQYIEENDTGYLLIKHKVENSFEDKEYRKYFGKLKEEGILINDNYEDNKWVCFADKDSATRILQFTFEAYPKINSAVKNYILVKLFVQKSSLTTVKKRLLHIRHFLEDTNFMNPDHVKNYQNTLSTWNENKKREIISVREFLAFCNLENAETYFKVVKNITRMENSYRKLPDFKAVLTFDRIVDDYWNSVKDTEDRYRLFPIVLWWKLTTVIPTRPMELYNLKRNCVFEKDGRYFLKIERQKTELDKNFILGDIVKDFEINEELYTLLHDYIVYCKKIDDCKYLLSPPTCDIIYRKKVLNTRQKFTTEKMNNYRSIFEKEVVEGKYHYKVIKGKETKAGELPHIFYGDTRHLAIMNMMMQGVNPIYIAQLAGHHTLDAQVGYYSHLETFATSKTYALNQFMKRNGMMKQNHFNHDAGSVGNVIRKDLLGADYYNLPKVAGGQGRCRSQNVPYDCSHRSCLFCQYFLPENISEDYLTYYEEENERDMEMIKRELKEFLAQTTNIDGRAIKQDALQLGALINQKIFIDSYRYKKGEESG